MFTEVKSLGLPYPDVLAIIKQDGAALPGSAISGKSWVLTDARSVTRLQAMVKAGVALRQYTSDTIYRGVVTGRNESFVIDGATRARLIDEDRTSDLVIKPLIFGKAVRKWRIDSKDKWLIFTRRGIDIDKYPAIKRQL